ncbi:hypothetical protein EGW08_003519 [Elysia chlorotica]|uniref:Peptidase metallopeptidase domain-containing protein n=1 Tax=Elysia chlorotica TaxID=188477 RepID=A0A433U4H5_ELYCH|nr:hypothetical protein EGW08_003519 [Elysia chlorotica]
MDLLPKLLVTLYIVECLVSESVQMSTLWSHSRHLDSRLVYPDWPEWSAEFKRFRSASKLSKEDQDTQRDTLLYCMGRESEKIFSTFKFEEDQSFEVVLKKFDDYFIIRRNVIYERTKFQERKQKHNETVEEFYRDLRDLAKHCNYQDQECEQIRDRMVVGLNNKKEFLHHLGYLDQGHGFLLHTRAERRKAIRLYQRENGLLQTGKIDGKTWRLMKSPRCAVPDRGEMAAAQLPWFQANNNGGLLRRKRAAPDGNPKKSIRLNEPFSLTPDIEINFGRREHGDGWGNAFDGRGQCLGPPVLEAGSVGMLLAHAFPPGEVPISGDIHFDSDEPWTVGVNNSETRDLMMIAMHEAGHALGLAHSKKRNDIMYPVYLDYNSDPQLSRGDIWKLQKLYGKRPGFQMPPRKFWRQELRRKGQGRKFYVDRSLPRYCRSKFNAVVLTPEKTGYIFLGEKVYRVNDQGTLPGYPVHVGHEFPGAPINAALVFYVLETDKLYFFKKNRFWRFSYKSRSLDEGYPMESKSAFWEKPRSVLAYRDSKGRTIVYLFGGKHTWRWNFYSERMNGRYHLTSTFWRGLPPTVDAAVEWSDGYFYFFQHNKYGDVGSAVLRCWGRLCCWW